MLLYMYKLYLDSNNFFSTTTPNSTGNRKYAVDLSFLQNEKYLVSFEFNQPVAEGTRAMDDNWDVAGYTYTEAVTSGTISITRQQNNLRVTMTNPNDPRITLAGTRPQINTQTFKYIHLRYRVISGTPNYLELYYYSSLGGSLTLTETKKLTLNYDNTNLAQWKNIVFDMTNEANWTLANWDRFRLDPMTNLVSAVIEYEYLVVSDSPNYPITNTDFKLVKLNIGSLSNENLITSSRTIKNFTNFSGVIQSKRNNLEMLNYAKPFHNPAITLKGGSCNNFVEVDICDADYNIINNLNSRYRMSVYFQKI